MLSNQREQSMFNKILAFATAISVLFLLNCNHSIPNLQENAKVIATDTVITDGHTSANSLDIEGEYKGTLPCADCDGIETKIMLNNDGSYLKQSKYLGKNGKVFEEIGLYSWNKEGNKIKLYINGNNSTQYFVGENKLIQLDASGNRITGNLADKYVLLK